MTIETRATGSEKFASTSKAAALRFAREHPIEDTPSDPTQIDKIQEIFQARLSRINQSSGIIVIDFGVDALIIDASSSPAKVVRGRSASDSTISMSTSVLLKILTGSLSATRAFMHGQLKVSGSYEVVSELRALWRR